MTTPSAHAGAENPEPPERRDRFSTQVRGSTQDRARAAVRGVRAATGADYSLAQLTEEALDSYCEHLERTYHHGEPWPAEARPLRPGRL